MESVLISGCGDIGVRVARRYLQRHSQVYGLCKRPERAQALENWGISPWLSDLDEPGSLTHLPTHNQILFHFAPPPSTGEQDTRLRNLLQSISKDKLPKRLVLISTTAVYGNCEGRWIDESEPANPQSVRGQRRLDSEQVAQQWSKATGVPVVILRVAGIYGPGRLPIERIQQAQPMLREDLAPYSNRIHADDLAAVCVTAADQAPAGAIYNATDGHPGNMTQYFKAVARAADLPIPEELDWDSAKQKLSEGMLSYLNESKRISNKALLELGVEYRYRDVDEGILASLTAPFYG